MCNSASEQTIADDSSSSNEVTVPQIEQAGSEPPRGNTKPVAGLSETQFRRDTPQDEEHRRSSGPTDVSSSSLDQPSQPKLVQHPAQVTAKGKPKRSLNDLFYEKHLWLEYSVQDDSVYYFCCRYFGSTSTLPRQRYGSRLFIEVTVRRWKDISNVLEEHTRSDLHEETAVSWTKFKAMQSIASVLMTDRNKEIKENS
ncbi:hypothetical protein QYM36_008205 [Artemia franciscana]|uniref:TTF-type domain-containing protein n=1 Tax=Artemia franciscana TaxID=6661 RepID=A0AA88IEA0_ARTSF|nr:hypothetical protein QYM36_008205 [Artemia franciscana]